MPEEALRTTGGLHLKLGFMSLPTLGRVEAAVEYLRRLNVNAMLNAVHSPKSRRNSLPERLSDEQVSLLNDILSGSVATTKAPGLRVTISSLVCIPAYVAPRTSSLTVTSHDVTSCIQPFALSLFQRSTAAGFLVAGQDPSRLYTCIIDMRSIKTQESANELAGRDVGGPAKRR